MNLITSYINAALREYFSFSLEDVQMITGPRLERKNMDRFRSIFQKLLLDKTGALVYEH